MGLFNKKSDAVPELPKAPKLPELPKAPKIDSVPELPSLPGVAKNNDLNQQMVKSAVDDPSAEEGGAPMLPSVPKTTPVEIPKVESPTIGAKSAIPEVPEVGPTSTMSEAPVEIAKQGKGGLEPIFVRIDKFQDAKESLGKITEKTKEMKGILAKINEVRRKEEEEIQGWDEELENLKSMLGNIESEIFDQI